MRRVLFVDDETRILAGLGRMLRSLRSEWEMVFAEGGREALKCCESAAFDVVVSDARMPGMDGSELLREVMRLYPDTVRMILSGQCSRDSVLNCVGVAHQFLNKPCDPQSLKTAVQRVCAVRERFRDAATRTFISGVQRLPSQVARCAELGEILRSAPACPERVAETITGDVAMCAKVVQLVSSGFFGTPQHVSDVGHAVALLGLETITALLEADVAFLPIETEGQRGEQVELLNKHSIAVAAAAKQIAETLTEDRATIEDAHLAGTLHEIGDLAMLGDTTASSSAAGASQTSSPSAATPSQKPGSAEDVPNAGGYLAALWGMPDAIVQTIGYHRNPSRCPNAAFAPLTAVHVANAFLESPDQRRNEETNSIDIAYLTRIGCADRLNTWREMCDAFRLEGVLP